MTGAAPAPAQTQPQVAFTLLTDPLPSVLAVGESVEIGVRVESDTPFVMAIALPDVSYPGRGVFFDGSGAATRTTSADLYLTITGKGPTADLDAVQGWPGDESWPAGVAPLAIRVGVRFPGGTIISTSYLFSVAVV